MKGMKRYFLKFMLVFMLVSMFFTQSTFGFATQGIVTGRIYDELANSSNGIFQELYDMKLGWVRIEFEEFYPWPGSLTYNSPEVQANKVKFQNVINNAHAKGLKVLGVVGYSAMPAIANFPNTDASIVEFKNCVKWHLDNYSVDAIEIWNEPGGVCFTNDNLAQYAKTLIEVYKLKPSYPNVKFMGPASANAERGTWLGYHGTGYNPENSIFNCTAMLNYRSANSGKLPLDVISWHPYGTGGDPDGDFYFGRTFDTYYNEIKAYTDKTGRNVIGNYPIWFTEYGWDSNLVGLENQRVYTEKMIARIYAKTQVELPFLYDYRDDGTGSGSEGKSFGVRTSADTGSARKRVYYPFVAHSSIVGLFTQDGVNEWTVDQIIDEYYAMGARANFGDVYRHPNAPWYGDKAHYWGPSNNGVIQQFNYGAYGECGILMKWSIGTAYTVKGAIYTYYINNNGPYAYGWPTSREYWSDNAVWQNFENGKMKWTSAAGVQWIPN